MTRLGIAALLVSMAAIGSGCAPEVGSERWCERMADTPRGDWSANDALDYARHCILEGNE